MKTTFQKLTLLAASVLLTAFAFAQANNLVVFSQDGYKFTLIVNGLRQNEKPETNVKVTGLTAPNYKVRVLFADGNLAPIDQNVYMQWGGEDLHGKELFCSIQNTKKGLKLRPTSAGDITTTAAPDQVVYVFNPSGNATQYSTTTSTTTSGTTTTTQPTGGGVTMTTTGDPNGGAVSTTVNDGSGGSTTTTTTTTTTGNGGSINMNMGGVGVNINVSDNTGMGTTQTTTTTTTSSSTTTTTGGGVQTAQTTTTVPATSSTCAFPMSSGDFATAKKSVESKSFEDSKLTVAKQILNSNCLSSAQVKEIMQLFSFEETKLEWAKYAYGKTTDPQNYYQLNDAFTFETSIDDLNSYIEAHKH